ncbi:uncharacterized protein [Euwallacea similis]|uniref:uncharacterized protein n=1 Tax=Euwallacea similis TaxID=1736056 RepID=UPI003450A31E
MCCTESIYAIQLYTRDKVCLWCGGARRRQKRTLGLQWGQVHTLGVNPGLCACAVFPKNLNSDKMDMKKLIKDFRYFQRERKKAKLLKIKMSRYTVKYQKGAQPVLQDVMVEIYQRAVMLFSNSNGKRLDFLRDIDITTFNDTMNAAVVLHIDEGAESVSLEFINEETKRAFVAQLITFLQLSNNSSAEEGSDSGRSTLS